MIILISSCSFGKKDDTDNIIDNDNTPINVINDEENNTSVTDDVNVDDTNIDDTKVDDTNTDDTNTDNKSSTINTSTGDSVMTDDDKLVEDAIKEIDKIISEIEADVK